MSTGSSTKPATYPATGPQPSGYVAWLGASRRGLWRLRDMRLRTKLALILFVPLLAVLALATVRLTDVGSRAYEAAQTQSLTSLSANIAEVTQYMQIERMTAAAYLSASTPDQNAYTAATKLTDARIQVYTTNRQLLDQPPAAVQDRLNRIDDHLRTLDATRQEILDRRQISASEAVLRYGVVISDLIGYGNVLGQSAGTGTVADGLRAMSAFSRAKAGAGDQQALAYVAGTAGDVSPEERSALIATQTTQQDALLAFAMAATPALRSVVDNTVTGDSVTTADQLSAQLSRGESVDPADIARAYGAVVYLMYRAEQELERQAIGLAAADRTAITRQAAIEGLLVVLVLIMAVTLAVVLARSLNQSLRRLREGALAVANRDLPDAVARLRDVRNIGDGGAADIARQVRDPIELNSRDEVGQVAQAFNVVHREAVRIAAEQAALRTSVSAMFLNLARRSQSLVDRMIGELDQIERSEEDPKRLARLFELDHLATRMRRNDENLLVLAGADSSPPRREDALLIDALRAAQSEVELYDRIEFGTVDADVSIAARAVNDVVRLTAELLDNATRFSPPTTIVVADARRIRDYVVIQVEDRGLGMPEEQMDILNRRLAEPPSVDVAAFRLMGLAVVSLLASRYDIRVELRANLEGGTVAQIMLPSGIVVLPGRSIDAARGARAPQLDSGLTAGSRPQALAGRAGVATATLQALTPDPWRMPAGPHPSLPLMPSQRPASPISPVPPRQLPAPPVRADAPGVPPGRPEHPTWGEQPVWAGQPARGEGPPWGAQRADQAPAAGTHTAPADSATTSSDALGMPTIAYPTLSPVASPDLQVAVGFIAPDGTRIPPPRPPVSPDPNGWGAALAAAPPSAASPATEHRAEAPIFLQMQASWFKGHEGASPEVWGLPTAGYAPPPNPTEADVVPSPSGPTRADRRSNDLGTEDQTARAHRGGTGQNSVRPATAGPTTGGSAAVPRPRNTAEDLWRTAADEGWRRAVAAAEPHDAGTTRSGLPKRVPQAQLVPGGVRGGTRNLNRRSPDEVRGLLSAYHRGVQRGRTAAEGADDAPAPKENEQ